MMISFIVFTCHSCGEELYQLFIQNEQSSNQPLMDIILPSTATIGDLKRAIIHVTNTDPERTITVRFAGADISDSDGTPLSDVGISSKSTIQYTINLNLNKQVKLTKYEFSYVTCHPSQSNFALDFSFSASNSIRSNSFAYSEIATLTAFLAISSI